MMKRTYFLVLFVVFLLCISMAFGQLTWTALTSLPYGRQMGGIAATQEAPYYLYVIGGNVTTADPPNDVPDANWIL